MARVGAGQELIGMCLRAIHNSTLLCVLLIRLDSTMKFLPQTTNNFSIHENFPPRKYPLAIGYVMIVPVKQMQI